MQTRGIPNRSRRDASDKIIITSTDNEKQIPIGSISEKLSPVRRRKRNNEQMKRITNNGATTIDGTVASTVRTKRDAPGCITNYNAQRQLLVGCSQPNVIEVRPQCTEDGDEGIN